MRSAPPISEKNEFVHTQFQKNRLFFLLFFKILDNYASTLNHFGSESSTNIEDHLSSRLNVFDATGGEIRHEMSTDVMKNLTFSVT
jgi:hypothetical protein